MAEPIHIRDIVAFRIAMGDYENSEPPQMGGPYEQAHRLVKTAQRLGLKGPGYVDDLLLQLDKIQNAWSSAKTEHQLLWSSVEAVRELALRKTAELHFLNFMHEREELTRPKLATEDPR